MLCLTIVGWSAYPSFAAGAEPKEPKQRKSAASKAAAKSKSKAAEPFKLVATVFVNDQTIESPVYFLGDRAVEFTEDLDSEVEVVYDFQNMTWRDTKEARTVSLSECEKWAKETYDKSQASLAKVKDPKLHAFSEAMLDPKFKVAAKGNALMLTNDATTFEIRSTEKLPKDQLDRLYALNKLDAYRKAMFQKKFGPFMKLALEKELTKRRMFPSETTLTMHTPSADVTVKTTLRIEQMSEQELDRVGKVLAKESP